jgi:RsmE family RNA methyltransferase
MNMVLLYQDDFISETEVILDHRRAEHIINIHRVSIGDTLSVGVLNGKKGRGEIIEISDTQVRLAVTLTDEPPTFRDVLLVMALPRPQTLKKVLQATTSMGIKMIHFIHTKRVEKSYWHSPLLEEKNLNKHLVLGLEQGMDTVMPTLYFHKRFKPFAEEVLPELAKDRVALIAHPVTDEPCPYNISEPILLAIGPEGGFNEYEVEKCIEVGLKTVHIGEHILRVEYAVPFILGRL